MVTHLVLILKTIVVIVPALVKLGLAHKIINQVLLICLELQRSMRMVTTAQMFGVSLPLALVVEVLNLVRATRVIICLQYS